MRLGIRGKLFLSSFALILLVVVGAGAFLSQTLKENLGNSIELELIHKAAICGILLENRFDSSDVDVMDSLADRLGATSSARVTVVGEDGTVLGDSELTGDQIASLENHNDRPEITNAFKSGSGLSLRFSTTVESDMIYAASRFESGNDFGVVRVSRPLREVDEAISVLYSILAIAGLIGLGLAVSISVFTSHYFWT